MADLEKLTVLLEAQTKQFDSAMKRVTRLTDDTANKASRSLSRLDKQFNRTGLAAAAMMKNFAVGAIGGIGIERIASSIGQAVKQMAELADEAKRAGVSAEDLQAVGFAAMQAGSSTEEMVDLFKKFNVEVGEASTKANDLAKLFEANNVALRNQDGTLRSTKDLFYEITNLIANAKSQQEAAVIAQMAFGKAAGDALPFLQQGAAAIKESEQNARNLGAVISNETIAKADEFDERWSAAWATWEVRAKTAVIKAYDFMVKAAPKPDEMLPGGQSAAGYLWKSIWGSQLPNPGSANSMGPQYYGGGATPPKATSTILPTETDAAGVRATTQAVQDLNLASEDMLDIAKEATDAWTKAQLDAQQAVVDLGELGFESLWSIVEGSNSAKEALRDLVMQLSKLAFQSALFGQGPFAALTGSQGNGLFNMLGSSLFPARASGGSMMSGRPYMVGERGPELVVPDRSSYVVPNGRLGGNGGGYGNVIVNNYGAQVTQSERNGPSGKELVLVIKTVGDSQFAGNLNRNAPLIGGRPASKRTS